MILDPGIEKILPLSFVKIEMAKFPRVRAVRVKPFLYDRKNIYGCYLNDDEEIWLALDAPLEFIVKCANAKHEGFDLKDSEAWLYGFAHECKHSQSRENEWEADQYARSIILQRRAEAEQFYTMIKNVVREVAEKAVRGAFR